jgi:hemoglobin
MQRPTLFEFAGGEGAFLALAEAHHRRCLADPVLSHPFSHPGHPDHVARLGAYWAEVLGGPPRFTEAAGGHTAMIGIHAGQGADEDLGRRFVECFVAAADDAGLPDDPEFRAALRAYMEWAVDEVQSYSPPGSRVPATMPMPRWGWSGLDERTRP